MTGGFAKAAAGSSIHAADRHYIREKTVTCLTRKMPEVWAQGTWNWIQSHVNSSRLYRPPRDSKVRPDL